MEGDMDTNNTNNTVIHKFLSRFNWSENAQAIQSYAFIIAKTHYKRGI